MERKITDEFFFCVLIFRSVAQNLHFYSQPQQLDHFRTPESVEEATSTATQANHDSYGLGGLRESSRSSSVRSSNELM